MNLLHAGAPLEAARVVALLLHGRGSSARDIISLAAPLQTEGVAFLAPEARLGSWYPRRFLEPTSANQPFLDAALETVRATVAQTNLEQSRVALIGFSQGACLALESAHRAGGRWHSVIAFSGGLIGAGDEVGAHGGAKLEGTPVFLGCSDVDPHIPLERVQRSAELLEGQGARVDTRIYSNFGHGINEDELEAARALLRG
jgi:phospholipase/carboxylesterase